MIVNAIIFSTFSIIFDRKYGSLGRSFACGVKPYEIVISHLIIMIIFEIIQTTIIMVITYGIFGHQNKGNFCDVIGLILFQGFQGKKHY